MQSGKPISISFSHSICNIHQNEKIPQQAKGVFFYQIWLFISHQFPGICCWHQIIDYKLIKNCVEIQFEHLEHEFEHLDASDSTSEGDFSQTIALLEMEAEEVHIEVERSLEEVSD